MAPPTTNLRIDGVRPLLSPAILMEELPISTEGERTVDAARRGVKEILFGTDDRLVVVVGPCSIHDPGAALKYAELLKGAATRLEG